MNNRMASLALCCGMLVPLAACSAWVKPGATAAERRAALSRCEARAQAEIPPRYEDHIERPGYWEPSRTVCGGPGLRGCRSEGGGFRAPQYRTRDANATTREAVLEACMGDQGWTRQGGL